MRTLTPPRLTPPLVLSARTAGELMTPDPKSVRHDATVAEVATFLSTRGFSAAPVIDEAGRPVGVVSRTDLLSYQGQRSARVIGAVAGRPGDGVGLSVAPAEALVSDVMTPAVYCVSSDATSTSVVEKMLALNVRRLFVVDDQGVLIGVVSAFDVLRALGGRAAVR